MSFTSLIFLFLFLPAAILGYHLIPHRLKNAFLFLASLVFYAWGGVSITLVLIVSILVNYFLGILIENSVGKTLRRNWFLFGIIINISGLVFFKYTAFLLGNLNLLTSVFHLNPILSGEVVLPLGISFFTFKSICYLITVNRNETPAQRNILNLGLYIGFFPTLIAGPIDRYRLILPQLGKRPFDAELFASGIRRFALGMAKKVIISSPFAFVVDHVFSQNAADLNTPLAWLAAICYMMQIYYDFSGYTDMAIGLGRMFGFHISENFNFPYAARSIRDFWKRWHITLSTWLRDYLFLPLAYSASRKLSKERYFGIRVDNLIYAIATLITFFVCGLWHGSAWTFIVWGLVFGLLLVLEHSRFGKRMDKGPAVFAHVYTLFFVMLAWLIFRSPDLSYAMDYIGVLSGFSGKNVEWKVFMGYFDREFLLMSVIAIAGCIPALGTLRLKAEAWLENPEHAGSGALFHAWKILSFSAIVFVLLYSQLSLLTQTLQAFIYFRF